MHCPKCNHIMGKVTYKSIEVDRCVNCRGIWFDRLEVEQLKNLKGSDLIDTDNVKKGEAYNRIREISCPKCNIPMVQKTEKGKSHIAYETCNSCQGLFLDAGEFKRFKSKNTILNYLKNIFNR